MPGPVAIASHTCSGDASNSSSLAIWNECDMSTSSFVPVLVLGRLGRNAGMDRDNQPVAAPARGVLVVVLVDQGADRGRQFVGERVAFDRGGEPDLTVQGVGRERLAHLGRTTDQG